MNGQIVVKFNPADPKELLMDRWDKLGQMFSRQGFIRFGIIEEVIFSGDGKIRVVCDDHIKVYGQHPIFEHWTYLTSERKPTKDPE